VVFLVCADVSEKRCHHLRVLFITSLKQMSLYKNCKRIQNIYCGTGNFLSWEVRRVPGMKWREIWQADGPALQCLMCTALGLTPGLSACACSARASAVVCLQYRDFLFVMAPLIPAFIFFVHVVFLLNVLQFFLNVLQFFLNVLQFFLNVLQFFLNVLQHFLNVLQVSPSVFTRVRFECG
jgi:hypothetical protein